MAEMLRVNPNITRLDISGKTCCNVTFAVVCMIDCEQLSQFIQLSVSSCEQLAVLP